MISDFKKIKTMMKENIFTFKPNSFFRRGFLSTVSISFSIIILISGCATVKFNLFVDKSDPLKEFTLQGTGREKILLININGIISSAYGFSLITDQPSMVEDIVSQLQRAQTDDNIKAVLLKVDSPGGLTTASDILYQEIMDFKKKMGVPIVVSMMDVATSGAYMISLPADCIIAHPTTVTGSIGVIFMRPRINGLMDKIGINVDVDKSGRNKDMGSPFRDPTEEEKKIFQGLIDNLNGRFMNLVTSHRKINKESLENISTACVYLADEALKLGLIDKIGYLKDAVSQCKETAGLSENAKLIVYRRIEYPDDNIYNTSVSSNCGNGRLSLIDLGILNPLSSMQTGFYYIWAPAAVSNM